MQSYDLAIIGGGIVGTATAMELSSAGANSVVVLEAEAEVPKAMAQAFREGNLGIFDYYNMKNIQADTGMRDAISGKDQDDMTKTPEKMS